MNNMDYRPLLQNRTVLVTGGTGSIGARLVQEILRYQPRVVRVYSRDETKQLDLYLALGEPSNIRNLVGDVRDAPRLGMALEGVDIVFHTAALKHVTACEYNPFEAVKTNVIGTQNLIDMSIAKGVKLVMGISTDKVVNPSNVLGTTKLMAEKLLVAANLITGKEYPQFSCVRFGNVAGARGSVIPIFLKQLRRGGPLTVTDPEMTRFIMSFDEAVALILQAASLATGGEVFILSMPAVRVMDVAETIRDRFFEVTGKRVEIRITGVGPGEKLHEELVFAHELSRCEQQGNLFIIHPEIIHPDYRRFTGRKKQKRGKGCSVPVSSREVTPLNRGEILRLVSQVDRENILKLREE